MTPRPRTRRYLAVAIFISTLILLPVAPATAAPVAAAGDRAVGPEVGVTPVAPAASNTKSGWSDVPAGFWDRSAIDAVARDRNWMRDYGSTTFRPTAIESRRFLARTVVRAFAPNEPTKPGIKFSDLPPSDPFYRYANVAVKLGWMRVVSHRFLPKGHVTTLMLHRALVDGIGLGDVAAGAAQMHTADGYVFPHRPGYGTLLLGMVLGLRYDHGDESMDVGPTTPLPRAEVAWSLYQAYVIDTSQTWRKTEAEQYQNIHLGNLSPALRKVVTFGMGYVGYPYVYAGEWYRKTGAGYCCGYQPVGGFDCSGLMWWLVKAPTSTYTNTKVRPYHGWTLNERSSSDMSRAIPKSQRIKLRDVRAGDLMFYDGDNDGTVDHVDLYIGFGWAFDSSSDGVAIINISSGWFHDHFVWARDITG